MSNLYGIFSRVILPVFFIILSGYVLQKILKFDITAFTKTLFYVMIPCLIFSRIYQTTLSFREFVTIIIFSLIIIAFMGFIAIPISRIRGHNAAMRAAFALSLMFYNSGNFGLPVIELMFKQNSFASSIQIMVLTTQNLVSYTLGIFMASKGKVTFGRSVKRTVFYPLIYLVIIALLLRRFQIPVWNPLWISIEKISSALVPVALITLGAQLAKIRLTRGIIDVFISSFCRLIASPLLALGLINIFQFDAVTARVLLVSSSMPSAVGTTLIAIELNNEPQFASQAVLFSTLISSITVSSIIYLSNVLIT